MLIGLVLLSDEFYFFVFSYSICLLKSSFNRMVDSASVAQLVEQLICNQRVGGSNPLAGFLRVILTIKKST